MQLNNGYRGRFDRAILVAALGVFVLLGLTGVGWIAAAPAMLIVMGPLVLAAILVSLILGLKVVPTATRAFLSAFLIAVFVAVDFTIRPEGSPTRGALDLQTLVKGFLYALLLVFSIGMLRRSLADRSIWILFSTYALVTSLSAIYSPTPLLALGSALAILAIAVASGALSEMTKFEARAAWNWLFWAIAAMAAASLAMYLFVPDIAVASRVAGVGRLRGVTGAPNSLGPILAIGIISAWFAIPQLASRGRTLLAVCALGMMIVALVLTGSRAAQFGLVISAGVMFLVIAPRVGFVAISLALLAVLTVVVFDWADFIGDALVSAVSRSGRLDEITSFTGRNQIWAFCINKWAEAPWLGFGLGSPRAIISLGYVDQWGNTTGSAHNVVLESLLTSGVIGTSLLLLFWGTLFLALVRKRVTLGTEGAADSRRLADVLIGVTVFVAADGILEKSFAGVPSPATVLLGLVVATYYAVGNIIGPRPTRLRRR